ncbi:hypothetical protein AAEX37_00992 [Oligella sp. MSHR50489EDL]|uniref:toprim domain-containing protein n=1 Tax=Oligella sp. MSHR50489EDL TaxID=3139409 RepID=UPI003D81A553
MFNLYENIRQRLDEFQFKKRGEWLAQGVCPSCGKRELYTSYEKPWLLKCNRLNKCGYEATAKELFPDLFEKWSDKYVSTETNPHAAADAYLSIGRGFDLSKIIGLYTQDNYYDHKKKIGSATVRFPLANGYWERIIDEDYKFDGKAHFMPGTNYKGLWWSPAADLHAAEEIWICEGIFDAIALQQLGKTAVSVMSCRNYPGTELDKIYNTKTSEKLPRLVWAFDNDPVGKEWAKKFHFRATEAGYQSTVAIFTGKGDWSDLLHKMVNRDEEYIEKAFNDYRYEGDIYCATTPLEKGTLLYRRPGWKLRSFDFNFNNKWYWFELDAENYQKKLEEAFRDGIIDAEGEAISRCDPVQQIAGCYPTPLYVQRNKVTDESWFYFKVDFPDGKKTIKNTFTAAQLTSLSEFKKRFLEVSSGLFYTGNAKTLERALNKRMERLKSVETIDYIGYTKEHGTYIFSDIAVRDGRTVPINEEDYFSFGRETIKSLSKSLTLSINVDASSYKQDWFNHLWTAFGERGVVALTFFFGSLFAEQIRAEQKSFPFLEIIGDPGTGKTTIIEFLWKLLGRMDYEGFDPSKSSIAGRYRNFVQVANLPVVLIESDRESGTNIKTFDWDELKTAYNGRSIRSRGVANASNDTYEPEFRGSIVISQNNTVNASEAIMQRICHLHFSRDSITEQSGEAVRKLERTPIEDVSHFIILATTNEKETMNIVIEKTEQYRQMLLANSEINTPRIALNHAQMLAILDALRIIVPINDHQYRAVQDFIVAMAVARQQAINADHPIVQDFWELYEYLNGDQKNNPKLNHSVNDDTIAINLNEFVQHAVEARQQVPTLRELKNHLKNSQRHRYIGQRVVHSRIRAAMPNLIGSTSLRCWLFSSN